MDERPIIETSQDQTPRGDDNRGPPAIRLDYERYAAYLDDPELSEEDRRALLEALWSIIVSFVQLGFGVSAAQHSLNAAETAAADDEKPCGQVIERPTAARFEPAAMVQSKSSNKKSMNSAHRTKDQGA